MLFYTEEVLSLLVLCLYVRIVDSCSHWYELMVGKLLFTMPLVVSTDYDLVFAAEGVMTHFPRQTGGLDDILLAALRNDVMEVIKLSRSVRLSMG